MVISWFVFGWKGKIYKLRRKYDRIREKADLLDNQQQKMDVLRILDQIENTLIMLEERRIGRFERKRLASSVKSSLEKAKAILDGKLYRKPPEKTPYQGYPVAQRT